MQAFGRRFVGLRRPNGYATLYPYRRPQTYTLLDTNFSPSANVVNRILWITQIVVLTDGLCVGIIRHEYK